jgi:predicted transcriptional regulator
MDTIKESAIETIKRLPDGCTIEDIMYELNFVAQVVEGINDADNGDTLTTDEVLKKVEEWSR